MKPLLFVFGWIAFAVGIVGAFVPILPTTPFLILAAFLFSKSSPRFHAWILQLPLAGPALAEWREHRVIRPRAKVLALTMMVVSLVLLWKFSSVILAIKCLVTATLIAVGIFVLTRSNNVPTSN